MACSDCCCLGRERDLMLRWCMLHCTLHTAHCTLQLPQHFHSHTAATAATLSLQSASLVFNLHCCIYLALFYFMKSEMRSAAHVRSPTGVFVVSVWPHCNQPVHLYFQSSNCSNCSQLQASVLTARSRRTVLFMWDRRGGQLGSTDSY